MRQPSATNRNTPFQMTHRDVSAYQLQRKAAQMTHYSGALLRITRATPTHRSASSCGVILCMQVYLGQQEFLD
jgi:hypothetical protein